MRRTILMLLLTVTLVTSAQSLQEVRGIETKQTCSITRRDWEDDLYCTFYIQFTNQNDFPVSIEALLFESGKEINSKSFELAAKETYSWAIEERRYHGDGYIGKSVDEKTNKYVKFKAYKSNATVEAQTTPTQKGGARQQMASNVTTPKAKQFEAKEIPASFPGGMQAFDSIISSVVNSNSSGKGYVLLSFAINKDGSMSDISVIENSFSSLNLNAISRYLSSANTPRWKPATQNGYPVKTYFTKAVTIR